MACKWTDLPKIGRFADLLSQIIRSVNAGDNKFSILVQFWSLMFRLTRYLDHGCKITLRSRFRNLSDPP